MTEWVTVILLWFSIGWNLYDAYNRRRKDRADDSAMISRAANITGLSELQIMVALDAGSVAFTQRVIEMQDSNRGR